VLPNHCDSTIAASAPEILRTSLVSLLGPSIQVDLRHQRIKRWGGRPPASQSWFVTEIIPVDWFLQVVPHPRSLQYSSNHFGFVGYFCPTPSAVNYYNINSCLALAESSQPWGFSPFRVRATNPNKPEKSKGRLIRRAWPEPSLPWLRKNPDELYRGGRDAACFFFLLYISHHAPTEIYHHLAVLHQNTWRW